MKKNEPTFHSVSLLKLSLYSILSLGIYQIVWFYKHWKMMKKYESSKVIPILRGIFGYLFSYSLFKKILNYAKSAGYQKNYSSGWLAFACIALYIIAYEFGRASYVLDKHHIVISYNTNIIINFLWLLFVTISFLPLLPIQNTANFNNRELNQFEPQEKFSIKEKIVVFLLSCFYLLVIWSCFIPDF